MASFASIGGSPLKELCSVSLKACQIMTPMVQTFYRHCNGIEAGGVQLKADASVFTIADGIVQELLTKHLYKASSFQSVVGEEEDGNVQITVPPYVVDGLSVPENFYSMIDKCRQDMEALSFDISPNAYKSLTIFIDPIDGTREFSTAKGEQCSICIGFSDAVGKPVAGIVYRPIDNTYATGARSEGYYECQLNLAPTPNNNGFLTSNGSISPFIKDLIDKLGYERVLSGGAGNKMLMLLEGKGAAYIQDRGVSRWDTSGAEAVIEAAGGKMAKLTSFLTDRSLSSYTYLKADTNLDFEESANLTPYNAADKSLVKKGDAPRPGKLEEFKAYSNLCGLVAVNAVGATKFDFLYEGMEKTKASGFEPSYD